MNKVHGWPVVTAQNCFEIIRECGIKAWPEIAPPKPIDEYLRDSTPDQRKEYDRFGPRSSVVFHKSPHNGEPFNGFTTAFKPYACVFALIDGMVPVTAEWKHGNNKITLVPPCGVLNKAETALGNLVEGMHRAAEREYLEETGFTLKSVELLSPNSGIWAIVRNAHVPCFPFLGEVDMSTPQASSKFDKMEHLQMVLFPLKEWLWLMEAPHLFEGEDDFCLEACARDVTYAALRRMGKLKLV